MRTAESDKRRRIFDGEWLNGAAEKYLYVILGAKSI